MKILHLIYTNGIAGAEKYLHHLLKPLKEYGIECHLLIVCAPGKQNILKDYVAKMNEMGITTTLLVSARYEILLTANKIGRYLKKNKITFLHSHLLNSDIIATLVKKIFKKNLVIISTKHGYKESILNQIPNASNMPALIKESKRDFYYYISKYCIRNADFNYAVSKAISSLYFDLGMIKERMPFIHHGLNVQQSQTAMEDKSFRFAPQQLLIVGRLEVFKGHQYLLQAMPSILQEFPACKLLIIGEGSEQDKLIQLSKDLQIDKHCAFLGFQHDPYSYVCNSDLVILPSLFEPFGLVYIESFALKTTVVAFDTPAGNEIMVNNQTACLVPPRNSEALADKIIYLLRNPEVAATIAEAAYISYQNSFTTVKMAENTAAFYRNVERKS